MGEGLADEKGFLLTNPGWERGRERERGAYGVLKNTSLCVKEHEYIHITKAGTPTPTGVGACKLGAGHER
jgi:hypothetical protein